MKVEREEKGKRIVSLTLDEYVQLISHAHQTRVDRK